MSYFGPMRNECQDQGRDEEQPGNGACKNNYREPVYSDHKIDSNSMPACYSLNLFIAQIAACVRFLTWILRRIAFT